MNDKLLSLLKKLLPYLIAVVVSVVGTAVFMGSKTSTEITKLRDSYEERFSKQESEHITRVNKIQEERDTEREQYNQSLSEVSSKLDSTTQQLLSLKQSSKKQKLKIVKPDGTVIEKEVESNDTQVVSSVIAQTKIEFQSKINQLEQRWVKVHESRVKELKEKFNAEKQELLKKKQETQVITETVTVTNPQKLHIGAGSKINMEWYMGAKYTISKPFSIGVDVYMDKTQFDGVGISLGVSL